MTSTVRRPADAWSIGFADLPGPFMGGAKVLWTTPGASIPSKSVMHSVYPPYFYKIYKFPLPYFGKIFKFLIFSFTLGFC